ISASSIALAMGSVPMNLANAQMKLMHLSGREIEFYSAIVLLNTVTGRMRRHIDKTVEVMLE
ncbi:hypothetical protein, partial [Klebsiella aerogenes]|uniref:hypothetical protein n=1 Tax=Klebsiella aerogenes TaxID=548 RepID=UPI00195391B9